MDLILNEKENTNKIQNSNNVVHTISIIFNPKYLKLENITPGLDEMQFFIRLLFLERFFYKIKILNNFI